MEKEDRDAFLDTFQEAMQRALARPRQAHGFIAWAPLLNRLYELRGLIQEATELAKNLNQQEEADHG